MALMVRCYRGGEGEVAAGVTGCGCRCDWEWLQV